MKVDEPSSKLYTFNSPFGRYRLTRLPFGINCAQDIFQVKVDETYAGLDGVTGIADDSIVFGRMVEEHHRNLRAILLRSRHRGVQMNSDKCIPFVIEVSFFGNVLSADGLKPDPADIRAIKEMSAPTSRGELEPIFGMVKYLSKFAINLAEITSPFRQLLTKDYLFQWDQLQEGAFQKMKDLITEEPGPVLV